MVILLFDLIEGFLMGEPVMCNRLSYTKNSQSFDARGSVRFGAE